MSETIIRLAERKDYGLLQVRALAMMLSVDTRKIDVAVVRPFEVKVYGATPEQIASLVEGLDAEIVGG